MKKIKIFMVAALACCAISVSAQDAYQQAVVKYMDIASKSTLNTGKMVTSLKNTGKSEAECKAYVDKTLFPKMIAAAVDAFKKEGVTIDDLNTVTAAFETPEGKKAYADYEKASSDENAEKSLECLKPAIMAIVQGQTAQPVPAPEVSASYKQKFHIFYQICNYGSVLSQTFESIKQVIGDTPEAKKVMDDLSNYLTTNGENIMLTGAKDTISETDIDFLTETYSTPEGKRVIAGSGEASKAAISVALQSIQEFAK